MEQDYVGWEPESWLPHIEDDLRMEAIFEHVTEDCHCEGKRCTGPCGRLLPATPEFFHRQKKDHLHNQCKECRNKKEKEYRSQPEVHEQTLARRKSHYRQPEVHEQILAQQQVYRSRPEVREHRNAQQKAYHSRSEVREYRRNYGKAYYSRPEVQERERAYHKSYWEANRDRPEVQESKRAYGSIYNRRPEVRERKRVNAREYYWGHPEIKEKINSRLKVYYRRPEVREKIRASRGIYDHARRARKRAALGTHTVAQIREQLKRQHYRCYYLRCGQAKFPKGKSAAYGYHFHIEHIIPLSRTEHNPRNDMSNIVLACESCNTSKNNKLPHEWPEGGRLF